MSVIEQHVISIAHRTRLDPKYQSRIKRAEWTISPLAASSRTKHSYFPAWIAITIPGDLDSADSHSNAECAPDPDEILSGDRMPVAAPHMNGLRPIHAASNPDLMIRCVQGRVR